MRDNKGKDHETTSEHTQTEWVLCSEDWRDIVITYVPQLNDIAIEDKYVNISLEGIKDTYIIYGKWRKPHKKKARWMHMLSSFYNFYHNFCCNVS